MIRLLLLSKIRGFFLGMKSPWRMLLTILHLVASVSYGWLLATLINEVASGKVGSWTVEQVMTYVLLAIAGLTLSRMILPTYQPQKRYFPAFYPLSSFEKYLFSIVVELTDAFFFYTVLFAVVCACELEVANALFLYSAISTLLSAHLVRRIVQYPMDNRLKKSGWLLMGVVMVSILLFFLHSLTFSGYSHYWGWILPIYLFFAGFLIELQLLEKKKKALSGPVGNVSIYLKLIINNPKARMPLLPGFVFKLVILVVDVYLFKTTGKHLLEGQFIYWMFASPLILFTYVFNNAWGFWQSVWLNYELRSGDYQDMMQCMVRVFGILLGLDFSITVPILLAGWDEAQFILIFYVVSSIVLASFSFAWSLLLPIPIKSTFQMRRTTAPVGAFSMTLAIVLLALIKLNYWFYILIPFYLVLAFLAYRFAIDAYRRKKYALAEKLLKQ